MISVNIYFKQHNFFSWFEFWFNIWTTFFLLLNTKEDFVQPCNESQWGLMLFSSQCSSKYIFFSRSYRSEWERMVTCALLDSWRVLRLTAESGSVSLAPVVMFSSSAAENKERVLCKVDPDEAAMEADLSNNRCFFRNPLKETSRSYLDVEPAPVRPQTVVSHAGGVELKVIDLQRLQTQRRTVCRERRALTRNRSSSFILMISAAQRHAHNIYLFV